MLLCGWGETSFMVDLMHELDHGPASLPYRSSVTLLNTRPGTDILGAPAEAGSARGRGGVRHRDVCLAPSKSWERTWGG